MFWWCGCCVLYEVNRALNLPSHATTCCHTLLFPTLRTSSQTGFCHFLPAESGPAHKSRKHNKAVPVLTDVLIKLFLARIHFQVFAEVRPANSSLDGPRRENKCCRFEFSTKWNDLLGYYLELSKGFSSNIKNCIIVHFVFIDQSLREFVVFMHLMTKKKCQIFQCWTQLKAFTAN